MEDVKFDPDEGIITKDGLDFPNLKETDRKYGKDFSNMFTNKTIDFESYLQEEFMEGYGGFKDDFEEGFIDWLQQLDVQELIDFGQQYAEKISLIR